MRNNHQSFASVVLTSLPPIYSPVTQAGALSSFLHDLLLTDTQYAHHIQKDYAACVQIHFRDMAVIVPPLPGAPVQPSVTLLGAEQRQQQQQYHQQQQQYGQQQQRRPQYG